ncbi:hypothetical protein HK098_005064 [Nowakowskiella sp. JEL0407]|nr:hypothetical protein HK098_005064 [Nowakowskiella sp. JEL0407]
MSRTDSNVLDSINEKPNFIQDTHQFKSSESLLSFTVPLPPSFQRASTTFLSLSHVAPAAFPIPPINSATEAKKKSLEAKQKQNIVVEDSKVQKHGQDELPFLIALSVDFAAAALTSLAVAPTVAIIDKAIVSHAAGVQKLGLGVASGFLELIKRPFTFMKQPSVLIVAAVYAGTFGTANATDSICAKLKTSSAMPKFISSSAVNLGLSLWKDRAFTVWYSSVTPRSVPLPTYALYGLRDALTMAASFSLPPVLGSFIHKKFYIEDKNSPSVSRANADFIAQLMLPCALQFITTPIHLGAIDMYMRPMGTIGQGANAWKSRLEACSKDYAKNVSTRMFRILPAFGLGGNMNRSLKSDLGVVAKRLKDSINSKSASIFVNQILEQKFVIGIL